MPTYSYRCTECERAFDIVQSFTDDTLTVCPTCGGVLRKVFSPVGVSFSGSGFYRTDSRAAAGGGDGGSQSSSKPESAATSTSESSGSTAEKSAPKKDAAKPAASATGSSGSTPS